MTILAYEMHCLQYAYTIIINIIGEFLIYLQSIFKHILTLRQPSVHNGFEIPRSIDSRVLLKLL